MSEEYRSMWEGLGINMRRHDMLLTALPEVFRQVYLSQQRRPQAMAFYDFVLSEIHGLRVKELMDHKAKGGKVARYGRANSRPGSRLLWRRCKDFGIRF